MTTRGWMIAAVMAGFAALAGCAAGRTEYDLPADVTGDNRALLIERYKKGKSLFKTHCADCHGIFTAGKDSVPNFSREQLDNYDANFVKADQKNHAVARKLSQQQVDVILTFLRLRARESSQTGS